MEMKKAGKIGILALLSIIIVFIGSGVNFVHCHHDGSYRMVRIMADEHEEEDCKPYSGCMDVQRVEISPTVTAQQTFFDFQVYLPLLPGYAEFFDLWQQFFATMEHVRQLVYHGESLPPRVYLQLLRVLLI